MALRSGVVEKQYVFTAQYGHLPGMGLAVRYIGSPGYSWQNRNITVPAPARRTLADPDTRLRIYLLNYRILRRVIRRSILSIDS